MSAPPPRPEPSRAGGGAPSVVVEARVNGPQGIHARPAARIVETARRFSAEVAIVHGSSRGSAKDLLDVLYLAVPPGALLSIEASGPDASAAVRAILEVIASLAGEGG